MKIFEVKTNVLIVNINSYDFGCLKILDMNFYVDMSLVDHFFNAQYFKSWHEDVLIGSIFSQGKFVLCFADKTFMENLPFTKYGFTLYEIEAVIDLLKNAGFSNGTFEKKTEQIKSNVGLMVERDYYVVIAC